MNGYIKLFRQLTDWEWYTDADTMRVFLHLLLKTNHSDHEWRGIKVLRGQCVTGRKELASELKISERRVRTALNHLKSTNEVTIKATSKYSVVTIENWALYQLDDGKVTSETTSKATNDRPASDQQVTTNKNDKNVKKERNIIQRENKERDDSALFDQMHKDFAPIKAALAKEVQ